MADLQGTTFLVTGANTGIGRSTATELARRGGKVVLACRSRTKTEPVMGCANRPPPLRWWVRAGGFYVKSAEKDASPVATPELAKELWERSEAWTAPPAS